MTGLMGPLSYSLTTLADPLTGGPRPTEDLVVDLAASRRSIVTPARRTSRPRGVTTALRHLFHPTAVRTGA